MRMTVLDQPPVIVQCGAYTATVTRIDGWYQLSCAFLGTPEPLKNTFCRDFNHPLSIGRALVLACRPAQPVQYSGWNYEVGEVSNVGWLTYGGWNMPELPDTILRASFGYEMGVALVQLGAMMQMRRNLEEWLNLVNMPMAKAV